MSWQVLLENDYVRAMLILAGSILLAKLLLVFFTHVVEFKLKKHRQKVNPRIYSKVELPLIIVLILAGFQISLRQIMNSHALFENSLSSLIVIVITVMFSGVVSIIIDFLKRSRTGKGSHSKEFHDEVLPLFKSLSKIVFVVIALMVILQIWGVQVGALLASLGVIGIILGFAFKDSLGNIFGGIALITDTSFNKRDIIKLESGELGEIIEITLRSTKIKTFDNDILVVPNGRLANTRFVNYAQPTPAMRIVLPVSIAYGSDITHVKQTLLSTLKGEKEILNLPPREARFMKMGEYSLDFELVFFIHNYKERFHIINNVNTKIYEALREEGIEIPFPTRIVHNDPKPSRRSKTKKKRT